MKYILRLTFILVFFSSGCTKYLDAVPDKSLAVPASVADYQALLENEVMFAKSPKLGEISADDLYLTDASLGDQEVYVREAYQWSKDVNEGSTSLNWNYPYQKIYYANIVLDGVEKLRKSQTSADVDNLKGWALFCRANALYDLQEVFGQVYKPGSAGTDLGIPVKLSTELQEKVKRSTVAATFEQIIQDLQQALTLVPLQISKVNRSRPSKIAVYALLARVYLTMQNYNLALNNADECLKLYSSLVDYNTLSTTVKNPFSPITDEVIYNAVQLNYNDRVFEVDRQLYNQYAPDDLRKVLYFNENPTANTIILKGFYSGVNIAFAGLSTDEVYLIKAECEARLGHSDAALTALNTVLIKRFKTGTYLPFTADTVTDILSLVLLEKRKECVFRGVRWSDLRRLNQDSRFAKILTRVVNGISYQLPPNDSRYVLPIPDDQIRISGIQQNIR
jgi:tetratricopeptide (TPR) repeat protein